MDSKIICPSCEIDITEDVAHFMIIIAVVVTVVTFKKAEDFKDNTENA